MGNIHAALIEVLIGSGNLDTTLPATGTEIVVRAGIVHHRSVDGQVVVMETGIHRTFRRTRPHTILVLAQHRTATASQSQTDNHRLGVGSHDAEAGIALAVHLRILLSGLVHHVGAEVFFDGIMVKSGVEIADDVVNLLGLILLVEGQRMVVDTQPRVAVAQIPEGDAVDDVAVLAEHAENAVVLVILQRLQIGSQRFGLTTREAQLSAHLGVGANIQFRHVDVLHQLRILRDGSVDILLRGTVDVIMSLHTDAVDGYTLLLHLLHHIIYTVALARVTLVVVVIEQQRIGVGLMGKLEGLGDELVAAELPVAALAIGITGNELAVDKAWTRIVFYRLVDDIPAVDDVLIAVHHRMDMLAQPLVEHLLLDGASLLVGEHPVAELRVPTQAVASQLDAVLAAIVSYTVGSTPVPHTLCRMHRYGLHIVLSRHTVEFTLDKRHLTVCRDVTLVYGYSDAEVVLVGIFQSLRPCAATDDEQ